MTVNTLSERAMLASLNIRRWQATLTDKEITAEVASNHAVSEKRAGRYRKYAIDVEAPAFKAVTAAASELRTAHYFYTLPWGQDGSRILTTAIFDEYSKQMRTHRQAFDAAVKAFVEAYPRLKSAARVELNGMYKERDYPANIAAKFGVDIVFMPMPDAEDFRATLPDDLVTDIKRNIQSELDRTTQLAMREPYERLYEHISRMVNRRSDSKAVFRDTLVTGLADLCAILPGLNLTRDPQLEDLRKRAERMIADVNPQDLRDVPATRNRVARKAAEIQHLMADFMGAASSEAA